LSPSAAASRVICAVGAHTCPFHAALARLGAGAAGRLAGWLRESGAPRADIDFGTTRRDAAAD
jgi:hypothetical protein